MKAFVVRRERPVYLPENEQQEENDRTAEFFFPPAEKESRTCEEMTQDSTNDEKCKTRQTADESKFSKLSCPFSLAKPWRIRSKENFFRLTSRPALEMTLKELSVKDMLVKEHPKTTQDLPPMLPVTKLRRTESSTSLTQRDCKDIQKNLLMQARGLPFSRGTKSIRSLTDEQNTLCSPITGQSGISFWPGKIADMKEQYSPRWRDEMGSQTPASLSRAVCVQKVASSYPTTEVRPMEEFGLQRVYSTQTKFTDTKGSLSRRNEGSLPRMTAVEGSSKRPIAKRQLNIVARIFGDNPKPF